MRKIAGMTPDERREILDAVARGELSPDEAAGRLADEPRVESEARPTQTLLDDRPVRRVRIRTTAGAVKVVGDPTVTEADVSGPDGAYELRHEGDALLVEVHQLQRFIEEHHHDRGPGGFTIRTGRRTGRIDLKGIAFGKGKPFGSVIVRVNPDLPLDLEVTAGSLSGSGLRAPISCELDAGSISLRDAHAPINAHVTAGSLSFKGRIDSGESQISCDMGAVSIHLEPGSSVRGHAEVTLGRCELKLPNPPAGGEFVIGDGAGRLDIDGTMSSISVRAE
jgi:hypothetical protein